MLLGGVCSKSTFSNYFFFLQEEFFETNLDLSKHPQQVFWIFFSFTKYLFSIFVFIRVIGELRELCAKFWNFGVNIHGEIICQSRLLLNPFYSGPIVQCFIFLYGHISFHSHFDRIFKLLCSSSQKRPFLK